MSFVVLIALLAGFKSALSDLNFVALGLANFIVRIEPKVLKPYVVVKLFCF